MAVADAKPPLPGEPGASFAIASISPSDAAAEAIEEQLAGLDLTVAGGGAGFEPSVWEDVPAPVADDEAVPDDKMQPAGLGLTVAGVGAGFEPSGWEHGPDEVRSDDKVQTAMSSPAADAKVRFPRRPAEPDCSYYIKFGTCRFGTKCKFNHPARKKKSRVKGSGGSGSNNSSNKASSPDDDKATKEEYEVLAPDISDSLGFDDKGSASNLIQGPDDNGGTYTLENHRKTSYEIPKGLVDKRNETVSEGSIQEECKIPKGLVDKRNETVSEGSIQEECKIAGFYFKKADETNATKHEIPKGLVDKRNETVSEGSIQEECKYYGTPGGCKFGKACKYLHCEGKEGKAEAEKVHLNFIGLPLRPGGKECSYYMRTGSCKYATYCKFDHPDPSNVSSTKQVFEHENGVTLQQYVQGPSQTSVPIWSDQRSMSKQHAPFLAPSQSYNAGMMPPQGIYPSPDWTGYHQVPLNLYYPPGVSFQHFTAPLNHPMYKTADIPGHQQVATDDYPERAGQPECEHFVRSGFCKYKMKCRYHHPRSRLPVPQPTGLSPLGLPIKPDQPVCTYYSRFGVCKYGPGCMFNHPFNFGPPVHAAGPPASGQYPTLANFTV